VFAWDEFREIAGSVLDGSDVSVLQHGPTRGYRPSKEALPQILADRGSAAVDEMIVTTDRNRRWIRRACLHQSG
jgi:DNA-binding transcriptional MocR family regulator